MAVARDHGLDEHTIAKIDSAESSDLSDRHKAAIGLADALMTQPGQIPSALTVSLHEHFFPEELLEMTLDVMKWNYQKFSVALGVDDEVRPGELTDLVFDTDGNWVRPV